MQLLSRVSVSVILSLTAACSASTPADSQNPNSNPNPTSNPTSSPNPTSNPTSNPNPDPGTGTGTGTGAAKRGSPAPTAQCSIEKDSNGFFWRTSSASDYAAYVPASYTGAAPAQLIVGLHGCGDDAMNFATWGINPWATRGTQEHIGISIGGETGSGNCWDKGGDDAKVMAAIEDIASCFWIDRSRIVLAGFSSGGELAYRVGLMHASELAGILIENSSLYAAGAPEADLLNNAAWKITIAHRAHSSDTVFPLDGVEDDWATITAAGFPLTTSIVSGGHDGSGDDWAPWLIPQAPFCVSPQ